jgi:hypothetical protein
MRIRLHPHAENRLKERGANEEGVQATVYTGERFQAKYGRTGFRRNFLFDDPWQGKHYKNKQIEVYAVEEHGDW